MSPVEPESSSSSENQAKANTMRKKMEALGLTKSLWRGESLALLSCRVLEPAPGDIQTPLWLHALCKHTKPVPEVKLGFGWVFILVPSAS